jgi:copper chaperone NosL
MNPCAAERHGSARRRARVPLGAALAVSMLASCRAPGPGRIAYEAEACTYCHMTISEPRFAGQLVTRKGKVYAFDDVGCMIAFAKAGRVAEADIHSLWVTDFRHPDSLLDARAATYVRVDSLGTPMGSHVLAVATPAAADSLHAALGGSRLVWADLWAATSFPTARSAATRDGR